MKTLDLIGITALVVTLGAYLLMMGWMIFHDFTRKDRERESEERRLKMILDLARAQGVSVDEVLRASQAQPGGSAPMYEATLSRLMAAATEERRERIVGGLSKPSIGPNVG